MKIVIHSFLFFLLFHCCWSWNNFHFPWPILFSSTELSLNKNEPFSWNLQHFSGVPKKYKDIWSIKVFTQRSYGSQTLLKTWFVMFKTSIAYAWTLQNHKDNCLKKHADVLLFITHHKYIKTIKPTLNEKLITSLFNDIKLNIFWVLFLCLKPKKPENYTFFPILPIHFHICLPPTCVVNT